MNTSQTITLSSEVSGDLVTWEVCALVDEDGHLNIYITTEDNEDIIHEIDTSQGNGCQEQLALRFTTTRIEDRYNQNDY